EPGERLLEPDRAAVRDTGRLHACDLRPHYSPTNRRDLAASLDLELNLPPGHQAQRGFDERAVRRDVEDSGRVPWTHFGLYPELGDRTDSPCQPSLGYMSEAGIHWPFPALNLNIRVFPVSPYTRTTYCVPRRPRMYTLPDDDVPVGVKVTMSPEPSRIGSSPGAGLAGSTGGRLASAPKSTPEKWSVNRSMG